MFPIYGLENLTYDQLLELRRQINVDLERRTLVFVSLLDPSPSAIAGWYAAVEFGGLTNTIKDLSELCGCTLEKAKEIIERITKPGND